MSTVVDSLKAQREQLVSQIATAQEELRLVEVALKAIGEIPVRSRPSPPARAANGNLPPTTVDGAMLEAIRQGHSEPKPIHDWITAHYGLKTTRKSVSTKLWRLRKREIIKYDGHKWYVAASKERQGEPASLL
jgi:hypothetical protein